MRLLLPLILLAVLTSSSALALNRIPPGDVPENFKLYDRDGKQHNFRDYRGKFVLVNFWTVDCRHCREDMTQLELAYRALKQFDFEVIAINAGDSVEKVKALLELNPVSYLVLLDLDLSMRSWGVPNIPTAYLIAPDGQRIYRAVGLQEWGSPEMIRQLRNILTQDD